MQIPLAAIHWRPHFGLVTTSVIVLGIAFWFLRLRANRLQRNSPRDTMILLLPRAVTAALLVIALLDPAMTVMAPSRGQEKVLALLDVSSSMSVKDSASGSRIERAEAHLARIQQRLGSGFQTDVVRLDSVLHGEDAVVADGPGLRSTDLGKCLLDLASRPDIDAYTGIVLLTDGGDDVFYSAKLPTPPLYVLGIGTDPDTWNDVSVQAVNAPVTGEKGVGFPVEVEVRSRAVGPAFRGASGRVTVTLEELVGSDWATHKSEPTDLGPGLTRVQFDVPGSPELGLKRYRARVEPVAGEMSPLNNSREFAIDVRETSFHVLLFGRELGWGFVKLRRELASDPGISLTAMFRVSGRGSYQVQSDRRTHIQLRSFPRNADELRAFQCVILGSFPAEDLTPEQHTALRRYVEEGGSVIFLGGEHSFGRGGWHRAPTAALFPWRLGENEPELLRGEFPASVPSSARDLPIMQAAVLSLDQVTTALKLGSCNVPGALRTGAVEVLTVSAKARAVPAIALQTYGRGQTLGVATNTLWRWTQGSDQNLEDAYGAFWRQTVRHFAGLGEGGQLLNVRWNRSFYRPGEEALAVAAVAGRYPPGQVRVNAELIRGKTSRRLVCRPKPGRQNTYTTNVLFRERGDHTVRVVAYAGTRLLEEYEKTLHIAPRFNEGAQLELDHPFLNNLAGSCAGKYVSEDDAERIVQLLKRRAISNATVLDVPLIEHRFVFVALFLLVQCWDYIQRRRYNLV